VAQERKVTILWGPRTQFRRVSAHINHCVEMWFWGQTTTSFLAAVASIKSDALYPLCQEEDESSRIFMANVVQLCAFSSNYCTRLVLYGLQRPKKYWIVFSREVCQDL